MMEIESAVNNPRPRSKSSVRKRRKSTTHSESDVCTSAAPCAQEGGSSDAEVKGIYASSVDAADSVDIRETSQTPRTALCTSSSTMEDADLPNNTKKVRSKKADKDKFKTSSESCKNAIDKGNCVQKGMNDPSVNAGTPVFTPTAVKAVSDTVTPNNNINGGNNATNKPLSCRTFSPVSSGTCMEHEYPGMSSLQTNPVSTFCTSEFCTTESAHLVWCSGVNSASRLELLDDINAKRRDKLNRKIKETKSRKKGKCDGADSDAEDNAILDNRGRPLHDVLHGCYRSSLLSHRSKGINLRGFFNLFFIVLFVLNSALVFENIKKYGNSLSIPTSFDDLTRNWPALFCFLLMHLCIVGAYTIERFVGGWVRRPTDWSLILLSLCNIVMVLLMPFVTVCKYNIEPAAGTLLLCFSIVWAFKFLSLHHVCMDVRQALLQGDDMYDLCDGNPEEAAQAMKYPHSITLRHLCRFIVLPTMCFQFQYPRTPSIRWFSVLRHLCESVLCLALMKIVIDDYILMVVRDSFTITQLQTIPLSTLISHFFQQMIRLSIPNLYVWLLMFIGLFHHWCNILAEVTRFGDRLFYLDWWNASSFGEYWRKWNLPIHHFLNRHVNKPLLRNKVPKSCAGIFVFFISALMHEYIVVVPLHLGWTGWIFLAFMTQVPLMYFTNIKFFQDNTTVGNSFFWLVFCFTGQPLGILLYWYLYGVKHGTVQELDPSRISIA